MRYTLRSVTKAFFLASILCLPITPVVQSQPARNGPIIGDKSSKTYHRPDCLGYSKVSARNRVYFRTAAEAEKAGYKLAGNCPRRVK
jgi:Metal binding domain of Ada